MQIHRLAVRVRAPDLWQSEQNIVLASVRLLTMHRQWLVDGEESGMAHCIEVQFCTGPRVQASCQDSAEPVDGRSRRVCSGWHRAGRTP